jgi:hypothetical protein
MIHPSTATKCTSRPATLTLCLHVNKHHRLDCLLLALCQGADVAVVGPVALQGPVCCCGAVGEPQLVALVVKGLGLLVKIEG